MAKHVIDGQETLFTDNEAMADLSKPVEIPVGPDNAASLTPEQDTEWDRLDAQGRLNPRQIYTEIGATSVDFSQRDTTEKKPTGTNQRQRGPQKRFDPKTRRPASLASLSGRQRALAEVSDSWATK